LSKLRVKSLQRVREVEEALQVEDVVCKGVRASPREWEQCLSIGVTDVVGKS
jgi:hypothetical protein